MYHITSYHIISYHTVIVCDIPRDAPNPLGALYKALLDILRTFTIFQDCLVLLVHVGMVALDCLDPQNLDDSDDSGITGLV